MTNPFEDILDRLERIEKLLLAQQQIKVDPVLVTEFLTREETAKMLSVSLKTLSSWTKEGKVIGYRIGSRVRYRRDEIETSLKQIKTK